MSNSPQPLILLVEDEEELARLIANYLEEVGMKTLVFNRSAPALRFLKSEFANLLLLDINLPDQSGFSLLEEIRANDLDIPVIFLTGNSLEVSKIKGLELGGDDYITKPFSYPELVARIHAVLRRSESKTDLVLTKNVLIVDKPFDFCGATINPLRLEITLPNGHQEKIGRKEIGILSFLHQNSGTIITRKTLIHSVWGIHANVKSRSLDQYIVKARDLLKSGGVNLDCFRTVHGIGYIYDPAGLNPDSA